MVSLIRRSILVSSVLVGGLAAPLVAQTDLRKFPLSRAIPADVFLAVMAKHNPEREFLAKYWDRVKDAFFESGILSDCWDVVSDNLDEDDLDKIEMLRKQFGDVCEAVDWADIVSREMVFAQRYVTPVGGSPYEGVLLGQMDAESAESNYEAVKALLEQLVKFIESRGGKGAAVREEQKDGWKLAVFGPVQAKGVGIAVAQCEDVIAFGFGGLAMLEDSVALLRGKGHSKALVDSPRFKKALSALPAAEDQVFYWDMADMFQKIRGMMTLAAGGADRERAGKKAKARPKPDKEEDSDSREAADDAAADEEKSPAGANEDEDAEDDEDDADERHGIALASKVLDELSMFDFLVSVEWTDGHRVFSESITSLSGDADSRRLYRAFAAARPIRDFERFIPKEADDFSCSSGIDWKEMYRAIRDFVETEVPGGIRHLKRFDRTQSEEWGLDIEKDVLSVLSGGVISVSMGDDWVVMLGVNDEAKAAKLIKRLVSVIRERVGEEGGLTLAPVDIDGHKFTSISHPMMMMMGLTSSPVWGCADDHVILSSSSKAVKRCLATAKGEHANITRNKRFMAQGLRPDGGAVQAIRFTDERKTGENLQSMIGAASMASNMVGMFVGGGEMPPEVSRILNKVPPILAKLGPVAGKINFYESSGSYETFDKGRWHSRSVQNYKDPKQVMEADAADSDDASSDAEPGKEPAKPNRRPGRGRSSGEPDEGTE